MSQPFSFGRRIHVLRPIKPGPIRIEIKKGDRSMSDDQAVCYARRTLNVRDVFGHDADADMLFGCEHLVDAGEASKVSSAGLVIYTSQSIGTGSRCTPIERHGRYECPTRRSQAFDRDGFYQGAESEPFIDEQDTIARARTAIQTGVDRAEGNAVKARAWEEASAMATIEADGPDDPEAIIHFQGRTYPGQEYPGMMTALMSRDARLRFEGFDPFGDQA